MLAFSCRYVPPLTSSSPGLPDKPEDIQTELRKQDSLLAQIHSEMNAGFITKKREEQLWEVQRIITQLKRKLRSCEKKQEKSIDELDSIGTAQPSVPPAAEAPTVPADNVSEDTTDSKPVSSHIVASEDPPEEPSVSVSPTAAAIEYTTDKQTGYLLLPKSNPQRDELLRLQIEYDELISWQNELKTRILAERNEVFRLKQLCEQEMQKPQAAATTTTSQEQLPGEGDYERVIEHYTRENALLEHKKQMLGMELKEERRACIALQVELRMQQF